MASTLLVNRPLGADFPVADAPTFGVRNQHRFIIFPTAVDRECYWTTTLPEGYIELGLNVVIKWTTPAIAGDTVWGVSIERHDAATDIDADSFAAEKTVVSTALGTSGFEQTATVAFLNTEIDGLLRGEKFRLKLKRLGTNISDTLADNAEASMTVVTQDGSIGGGGGAGGFFEAGAGTDAVIGKGLIAPIATGDRSFAHGTDVDVSSIDSLALGDAIDLDGSQSLAIGQNLTIDSVGSDQVCVIGQNIDAGFSRRSLLVGRGIDSFSERNLMVGEALYQFSSAETLMLVGFNNYCYGDFSTIIGENCGIQDVTGYNFIQGQNNHIYAGCGYSFIQGRTCGITDSPRGFVQGSVNFIDDSKDTLLQGYLCYARDTTNLIGRNFGQGYDISIRGDHCLFQGSGLKIDATDTSRKSLLQGTNFTLTGFSVYDSIMQGQLHTLTDNLNQSLVQGSGHTAEGVGVLMVGLNNSLLPSTVGHGNSAIIGNDNLVEGQQSLVVGLNNDVLGNPVSDGNFALVGENNNFTGGLVDSLVVGGANSAGTYGQSNGCIIGNSNLVGAVTSGVAMFGSGNSAADSYALLAGALNYQLSGKHSIAAGYYCAVTGNQATAIGYYCHAYADNTFAHGFRAEAIRDQQRAWSSDVDIAQWSHVTKHIQTTDAVQTTLLTFPIEEGRAYSIKVNAVAWNTTTVNEGASFVVAQVLSYRETAGAAVLQAGPVSLTRLDSGGGAVNLLADIAASGNNLLFRVTGEAGETYEWCFNIEFTEVEG